MKVKKQEIDREVALQLGRSPKQVGIITRVFLHTVGQLLAGMKEVQLDGLGTLVVRVQRGQVDKLKPNGRAVVAKSQKKYRVSFRKSRVLTEAIRVRHGRAEVTEDVMEKYGVDERGTELEKKAAAGCPNCGAKVEKHGNVLACPRCGTEPFEGSKTK